MLIHFEWTEDMSVGEGIIDRQHQKLLSQLNTIIDAMAFGITSVEVTGAVAFFEKYVNEHFSYEENYLQRRKYFGLEEHKKKHHIFRNKYADFKHKLDLGTTPRTVLIEMEEFLGQWFVEHIGREDKKYHLALDGTN